MEDEACKDSGLIGLMKQIERVKKTITIETTREQNDFFSFGSFPRELNYRAHFSRIWFSQPVKDHKGRENKKLTLVTAWFSGLLGLPQYWKQCLSDEGGYDILASKIFGELNESFMNYSEERLREWQELGLNTHEEVLAGIKRLGN